MLKTICIISPFENCGTTATAVNLAAGIAVLEHRCLLLDFDPAFSAIRALRSRPFPFLYPSGRPITESEHLKEAVLPTALEYLDCIPAGMIGLDVAKIKPGSESTDPDGRRLITEHLQSLWADVEFMVLHFPASLGVIDFTGIPVPDQVVIPIAYDRLRPERADATSNQLDLFFEMLKEKNIDRQFQIQILVTMSPNGLSEMEISQKAGMLVHGCPVQSISIPKDDAVRKAALFGESVFIYDITAPAVDAFLELSTAIIETAIPETDADADTDYNTSSPGDEVVIRKTIIDARHEMIRRLSEGIDIEALKAKLLKTSTTACNEELKFLSGDFISHDGEPAFRLDFQYNGRWSVIIGINGEIFSIIEKFSSREETRNCEPTDTLKENPMAEKLAEMMAEINTD